MSTISSFPWLVECAVLAGFLLAWGVWAIGKRLGRNLPPTEDEKRRERIARDYPEGSKPFSIIRGRR